MEDYSINIYVKKSNIPNDLAEIVNFHFSHYKSMETLSCHSNQSSYPTGIKNISFVEGNILSKYAKFRLHPPYHFCEQGFQTFLKKLTLFAAPTTNKYTDLDKRHMKCRGLLNKHFCKKNPNISIETEKIANLHFSHYKSMGTISFHSNQSSYPTGIKKHNFLFPLPIDAIYGIRKESA